MQLLHQSCFWMTNLFGYQVALYMIEIILSECSLYKHSACVYNQSAIQHIWHYSFQWNIMSIVEAILLEIILTVENKTSSV